jgi:hypothetical protein
MAKNLQFGFGEPRICVGELINQILEHCDKLD